MPKAKHPEVGQKWNRLTAVSRSGDITKKGNIWIFRCDCGVEKEIVAKEVRSGNTKSCGCLQLEHAKKPTNIRHGMRASPEYSSWTEMKRRCLSPNHRSYKAYGGSGITVCKEWAGSFEAFYKDMGPKPDPSYSIDRIENELGYYPGNCRWSSSAEQNRNKGTNVWVLMGGDTVVVAEACRIQGIKYSTAITRIRRLGWSAERAVFTPARKLS